MHNLNDGMTSGNPVISWFGWMLGAKKMAKSKLAYLPKWQTNVKKYCIEMIKSQKFNTCYNVWYENMLYVKFDGHWISHYWMAALQN